MPASDGRRRRSETSRERIVAAMLELVAEGPISPSADQVAVRAAIGLRTVFRHFTDMESLYAEMTAILSKRYEAWLAPFAAAEWRGQLAEMLDRRVTTYEALMPFKRAADAHRHASPTIAGNYRATLKLMRARLAALLPESVATDPMIFEMLDLLLSFETWQRLRVEQGLSPEQARAIIATDIDRRLA